MTDRYAVIGNPIAHSKSPLIHAEFAKQTNQDMAYEAILAPLEGFRKTVEGLRMAGYKGLNVTVPFKFEAFLYATSKSERAETAKAVNTLSFAGGAVFGDNTDGIGLVADIEKNLDFPIAGKSILLVGMGGAAWGVLSPLLQQKPKRLTLSNRTVAKAEDAARVLASLGKYDPTEIAAKPFDRLAGQQFDIVINATSSGLKDEMPPLPPGLFSENSLAYDMMYGRQTPFMAFAGKEGASRISDGLGMLVEQAAEAFFLWRGIRPQTAPVIEKQRT